MLARVPGRQGGLSLVGFIFVLALLGGAGYIGFRAFPAYMEYFTVRKVLASTMNQMSPDASAQAVRQKFGLVGAADYIESVNARDIEVVREGGKLTANVAWQRKIHIVGNASLLLEFNASASR